MKFLKLSPNKITPEQFGQMVSIEENCGLTPYTPQMLRECVETMDTYAYMDGETMAGFITVYASARHLGGGIYIVNLNVAGKYRRRGIGENLIRIACGQYKNTHRGALITLDVEKANFPARSLYQKLGFRETDLPSSNGDTDIVMVKLLDELRGRK